MRKTNIHKNTTTKEKKIDKLIEQVEKEAYYQTYRILVRHFPFCDIKIIEENKVANEPGFYPENDTDFRISLRGGELEDYYNVDEDELKEKLFSGEITPEQAGEVVATLYIGKRLKMLNDYDLKDDEA